MVWATDATDADEQAGAALSATCSTPGDLFGPDLGAWRAAREGQAQHQGGAANASARPALLPIHQPRPSSSACPAATAPPLGFGVAKVSMGTLLGGPWDDTWAPGQPALS